MTAGSSRARSDEFESLINLANDAIIIIDLDGMIEFWNRGAARLYGWEPQEAVGQCAHDLLNTGFPISLEDIKSAVRRHGEWHGDLTHTTRDGRVVIVASRWSPRYANDGATLIGTFEINRDITEERKRAEAVARIEAAERLATLGRLAASVAHDLTNPLETIGGALNLLAVSESISASSRELIDGAQAEVQHAFEVIRNTLDLAKDSGRTHEAKLCDIIDQVLAISMTRMRTHRIVAQKHYTTDGRILCRPSELRQVVFNLIGNAIDSMRNVGGRLRVHLHQLNNSTSDPAYRFTVADDGHGIAPELQTRLFTPFTSTKGELGTGLGLWIVRGILARYGGSVRYRTRFGGAGHGTCFSATLRSRRDGT